MPQSKIKDSEGFFSPLNGQAYARVNGGKEITFQRKGPSPPPPKNFPHNFPPTPHFPHFQVFVHSQLFDFQIKIFSQSSLHIALALDYFVAECQIITNSQGNDY